jgi:NhaP-type Na+/H+ or K+/H+ antiporter
MADAMISRSGNQSVPSALFAFIGDFIMRVFLGMILGALLLVAGVYMYDSTQTSSVASGEAAQANRTIVNWDVAATDWDALKVRAHRDWIRLSSK